MEKARTEIRQGEKLIGQLRREVNKAERNARTSRLIQRGLMAEKLFRDATEFTNEQFQSILAAGLRTTDAREMADRFRKTNAENAAGATVNAE
jgi:hypothetical protein